MSRRPQDLGLTAAVLALAVAEALLAGGVTGPRWATALVAGALSVLLLWRRTHPVAASAALLAIVLPASATAVDPSELVATFLPLLILAYSAGAFAEPRGARLALALLVAGVVVVGLLGDSRDPANVYFPAALVLLCWLAGSTVRRRSRHAAELHEAAAVAAERREREARQAVADERRRIAREMHDVVAHSISLMVVQAGGARRILDADPVRAEEAATRIRAAGTEALAEMETLLGVLDAAPAEVPTIAGLVERARGAGLPVTLAVTGAPRALGAAAELAAYRVVQEALTNAIKHAGGATTHVTLAWGDEALELRVADEGDGGAGPQLAGAGHGLIGMRERLRVHGGDAESGPRPGGGFDVHARLPYAQEQESGGGVPIVGAPAGP